MTFIGNLLWFAFGGIWLGLAWLLIGLLFCRTITVILVGIACFNIAQASFAPLGKVVTKK